MPWFDFFWTDETLEKIAQHGISSDDVEFVISHPSNIQKSRTTDRTIATGYSPSGQWLVCVYEMIDDLTAMPITAYEPTDP